ncbi:hypothetical protein V8E36_009922 [Tilletia maclaganii]
MHYLHDQNIIHRDLKTVNMLVRKNGDFDVTDFGLSRLLQDGELALTRCGKPGYAAPEQFTRLFRRSGRTGGRRLCHRGDNRLHLVRTYTPSMPTPVSAGLSALVHGMLSMSPICRPVATKILHEPGLEVSELRRSE